MWFIPGLEARENMEARWKFMGFIKSGGGKLTPPVSQEGCGWRSPPKCHNRGLLRTLIVIFDEDEDFETTLGGCPFVTL